MRHTDKRQLAGRLLTSARSTTRSMIATLLIVTALSMLLSLAVSQTAVAAPPPPTVNGLFWGDGDNAVYQATAWGINSESVLYEYVDGTTLYVALVVDGNLNDNAFDQSYSDYMVSAGWPKARTAFALMNSEFAGFQATICGVDYEWQQGYARQFSANREEPISQSDFTLGGWTSGYTQTNGSGAAPAGYTASSSIVWNLNNYAEKWQSGTTTFDMGVNCGTGYCPTEDWKSPFELSTPNTVTVTGGFPEVISTTSPISYSAYHEWEWAMVYEWSIDLPAECQDNYRVLASSSHHSPSKTGISDDPTPVTLVTLTALGNTAVLPIAGLVLGAGTTLITPRKRRR